jgi:hypothetical protein
MSGQQRFDGETAPLEALACVHEVCTRFEAEWKDGRAPRIESYLAEAAES